MYEQMQHMVGWGTKENKGLQTLIMKNTKLRGVEIGISLSRAISTNTNLTSLNLSSDTTSTACDDLFANSFYDGLGNNTKNVSTYSTDDLARTITVTFGSRNVTVNVVGNNISKNMLVNGKLEEVHKCKDGNNTYESSNAGMLGALLSDKGDYVESR